MIMGENFIIILVFYFCIFEEIDLIVIFFWNDCGKSIIVYFKIWIEI